MDYIIKTLIQVFKENKGISMTESHIIDYYLKYKQIPVAPFANEQQIKDAINNLLKNKVIELIKSSEPTKDKTYIYLG